MADRKRWGRRREDKRVARQDNYAPIQAAETDADLAIPELSTPMDGAPSVFAFIGATGGVGTTSLCTQFAHELAVSLGQDKSRRPRDPRVCLIDLDFETGACAHHLDLLPSLSIADLCGPADQIDSAFTSALVSTHASGVSLLAAPNTPGAQASVDPRTVMAMLDAACELYDFVVIDLPRHAQPWTQGVMSAVDRLSVVCELTIPSLQAGRERLAHLATQSLDAEVILSKFERRSFKNNLRLSDAETALGREVSSSLCLDPDTVREALNCGEPAGVIRPESRFVKDVRKLANTLRSAQKTASVTEHLPQALTAA